MTADFKKYSPKSQNQQIIHLTCMCDRALQSHIYHAWYRYSHAKKNAHPFKVFNLNSSYCYSVPKFINCTISHNPGNNSLWDPFIHGPTFLSSIHVLRLACSILIKSIINKFDNNIFYQEKLTNFIGNL